MPPVYYLNPPPNPFWDFVASMEDHPFFSGPTPSPRGRFGPPSPPPHPASGATPAGPPQSEMSEKTRGKQATVEDPPEIDPSTIKSNNMEHEDKRHEREIPFRGRGRFAHALDGDDSEGRRDRRGHPCRSGRGRAGWNAPPPFMSGHPFFARPPWAQADLAPPGPPSSGHENRGPPGPPAHHHRQHRGPHSLPDHEHHGPPPHARGPHRHRSPHGPHRRNHPRPGFDLGDFLNNLGGRLGIDLTNAAEGLGLSADKFAAGKIGQETDFEPRADIFENRDRYTIHLSLPGAKKSDIGVDYDGEHSVLRITGVVHRPDVDEQMLNELVVDGRKRETGVFEKAVRLGTKRDPASIDVAGISAKMTDGILVVKVPKVEKVHHKREVPITTDLDTDGQANYEDEYSEKPVLFDAEDQASVAATENTEGPPRNEIDLLDMKDNGHHEAEKQQQENEHVHEEPKPTTKHDEAEQEKVKARPSAHQEHLPAYSAEEKYEEDDWEKFSDASGEGEYIKINVD